MTKKEFDKLSEALKMDICQEIAYEYAVFVPKDEQNAISKFKSIVLFGDKKFLDANTLENASGNQISPYDVITGKIESLIESYYREFNLGINTQGLLTKYGNRRKSFNTYFSKCLKKSQNNMKNAVKQTLLIQLSNKNDAKSAIKSVGDVISRRTASLGNLLKSLFEQMEQLMVLWDYQDKGFTQYRINADGESCEECQDMVGKIFNIADVTIDENFPPFHPNCDCTIEILDKQETIVYVTTKTKKNEQNWWQYLQASVKQLFLGNYTDDVNLLGTALQVLAGLFGADLPADIRDLSYDVTNFELTKEHISQTVLDTIALLPVIGSVKYADEAGDILKAGAKYGDEATAMVKNTQKSTKISSISDNLGNVTKKYKLTDNGYFGVKSPSTGSKTRNITSNDNVATATDFYNKLAFGGTEISKNNGKLKITTMSDRTIITKRTVSSSDGTPVVEINIRKSSNTVEIKQQKIHFIRKDD